MRGSESILTFQLFTYNFRWEIKRKIYHAMNLPCDQFIMRSIYHAINIPCDEFTIRWFYHAMNLHWLYPVSSNIYSLIVVNNSAYLCLDRCQQLIVICKFYNSFSICTISALKIYKFPLPYANVFLSFCFMLRLRMEFFSVKKYISLALRKCFFVFFNFMS